MPSFADSIFLFVLALLLFGPKRLPVLARELGKWVGEFRRASNEFKMQMDEELRASEQADRQKQIAAMEAAAPLPPPLEEPEHPHLRHTQAPEADAPGNSIAPPSMIRAEADPAATPPESGAGGADLTGPTAAISELSVSPSDASDGVRSIPIATSGDLHMMPPSTGLPTPRPRNTNPLGGLLDAIPNAVPEQSGRPEPAFGQSASPSVHDHTPENAAHGD